MSFPLKHLFSRITHAGRVWLFLDYDGTLADFAPTPDHVEPQPKVIELLTRLVEHPRIRLTVISGRRLDHLETLVPIPGAILAGTYGIEIRAWDESRIHRGTGEIHLPMLDQLKTHWKNLLMGREGFYLEDKGWAVALHARFADDSEADKVIESARSVADEVLDLGAFRILGGHKFLEIGPQTADKGKTVDYLLQQYPWGSAIPIYIGDDDKDEAAFRAIQAHGGIPILVAVEPRDSEASYCLKTPQAVHEWLWVLLTHL